MSDSFENRQEKKGVGWLKAIGRPDAIGKQLQLRNGAVILAEDFPDFSPHSVQGMSIIEALGPDNPTSQELIGIARQMVEGMFGPPPPDQQ